jgi:hypothetical protein
MSLRDHAVNFLESLLSNIVNTFVIAPMFFRLELLPWVGNTFRASRSAVVRAVAAIFALPTLLLARLRAQLPARAKIAQLTGVSYATSISYGSMSAANDDPLPPGTASAIVMASQPPIARRPIQPPHVIVNNSIYMQWEAAQRQHDLAARIAMQSTMPGFLNTLTPSVPRFVSSATLT